MCLDGVTILVFMELALQWKYNKWGNICIGRVTILVFMELALQFSRGMQRSRKSDVTILVFMELALQYEYYFNNNIQQYCHNPCFYGISFAITIRL